MHNVGYSDRLPLTISNAWQYPALARQISWQVHLDRICARAVLAISTCGSDTTEIGNALSGLIRGTRFTATASLKGRSPFILTTAAVDTAVNRTHQKCVTACTVFRDTTVLLEAIAARNEHHPLRAAFVTNDLRLLGLGAILSKGFLGISPDGSSGSAEIILIMLIVVIIAAIAWRLIGLSKR